MLRVVTWTNAGTFPQEPVDIVTGQMNKFFEHSDVTRSQVVSITAQSSHVFASDESLSGWSYLYTVTLVYDQPVDLSGESLIPMDEEF